MNKIGINQCKDILGSFAWDSTGYEECSGIRAREREDSHVFYFRDWFNIVTARGLREGRCFQIYKNSFSRRWTIFDEPVNVSLYAKAFDEDFAGRYERGEYGERMRKAEEKRLLLEQIEKERLIAKEVKKYTNLGKEYNQTSLYDTIQDCLDNGEELVIEPSKQAQANEVMAYIKYLNLEERIIALRIQELALNKEQKTLEGEIDSIKQQLMSLQEKQCAKQRERSNLQQKQKTLKQEQCTLQQEQDVLLR